MTAKIKMSDKMEMVPLKDIRPYKRNPRNNTEAVPKVAESILKFGFRNPIILDKENVVIAGHTRLLAAKKLGLKEVPCIWANDLSHDEVKALRIVDNKTAEYADWEWETLQLELNEIKMDMSEWDFDNGIDFNNLDSYKGEKDAEYQEFVDKFKDKFTTDDCFTPPKVYEAIKGWVLREYGHKGEIVRPFYPGGDYQSFDYPKGCLVLDNPPFSIAAEITRFYNEKGIDYFLFANQRTSFSSFGKQEKVNVVYSGVSIIYENGAEVPTSFCTNLGKYKITVSSELHDEILKAQPSETATLKQYLYPDNVLTAAMMGKLATYGANFKIKNIIKCDTMDDGNEIYGGGVFVCDKDAEKVKAEKVKAEKVKAEAQRPKIPIQLSERERGIIAKLNAME